LPYFNSKKENQNTENNCVFDVIRLTNHIDLARIEVQSEIKTTQQGNSSTVTIRLREIVPVSNKIQKNDVNARSGKVIF